MSGNARLAQQIKNDYRQAEIDQPTLRMLEFVEKTTLNASATRREDVETLKRAGFSDADILEITHITGFFNYINRLADALGVEFEDFMLQGRGNSK